MRKSVVIASAALGAGYLAWRGARRDKRIDLQRKIVFITGGSRGLGLQLAREFGSRGAAVAICARNAAELDRAVLDLKARNIKVHAIVCDVCDPLQVNSAIREIAASLGPVDILVNNAGVIKVGPASNMTTEDFDAAMNVIFWGALHCTLAVLPFMRGRGQGGIVNIASIGGKISVPHLLPYACAKFAMIGLSEGLRSELAPDGIRVTTIVPGLMRTGSHLKAEFSGRQSREYAWFGAGAATSLISVGAERAARSIVDATVRQDTEKILSLPADLAARLHDAMPGLSGAVLNLINRLLPSPSNGPNGVRTGAELEAKSNFLWRLITRPGQRAAQALNQA